MKLELFTYKIPFVEPFRSAACVFENREGLLIRLKKDGITALGEASPLPGFSNESLSQIINKFQHSAEDIKKHFGSAFTLQSTLRFLHSYESLPSLQFGLLTLAATFLAQQKNIPLQQLFASESQAFVPVNAVLGMESCGKMEKIEAALKQGYQTVKLKAGTNFSEFLSFLESVRRQYPDLSLRVDANQSWTFNQASTFLPKLHPYRIEYCEEPLAQPDAKSVRTLAKHSHVSIALDESVFRHFSLAQAVKLAPVLIVKPMIWGLRFTAEQAGKNIRNQHPKFVLTTSLESGIGRLMTASLAAAFGDGTLAHGLNTGLLLTDDLWDDEQFIKNGRFKLPDTTHLEALMNSDLPVSIIHRISTLKV